MSVMGRICRMEVTELARNAISRMMAEVIRNNPIKERHTCMISDSSMTASTMPSSVPLLSCIGTATTNFLTL